MFRKVAFFLVLAGWVFTSALAGAAPRDKAAQKKIEEAIYTNFLNTDFDAAEGLLLGTIRACEDKCSPELIGKAWMYVGVVRGSGRNDLAGATEAFNTALASDPNVALDNEIATEPVKAAFAKLKGGGGTPPPATGGNAGGGAVGAFTCAPSPTEIETRRPVPLQCESDKDIASAKLFYKSFSGGWSSVKMEMNAGTWRGTIPCNATDSTGKLKYYVQGFDEDKKVVVALGEKDKPKTADVVSETSADPPAYPEEEPPARCGVGEPGPGGGTTAPSEGGECIAYGASCKGGATCCEGMACVAGTCGEAECQSDSDCKNGAECAAGKCEGGDEKGGGTYSKNLIGLHFALDVASISSDNACSQDSRKDFIACFRPDGTTYDGSPVKAGGGGKITGGFAPSTMRVLASYERLFGAFGAELRLGFAFNGGKTPAGGAAFLPVHAEVRAKYWLLGEKAFTKPGFRPWIHLGGGLAQVDATVNVPVEDCSGIADATKKDACVNAPGVKGSGGKLITLDATKQLGKSFIAAGGGIMYAVAKNHGAVLNLNFMVPFPSSGFVLEPSLGYVYGF